MRQFIRFSFFLSVFLSVHQIAAQAPDKMSYQAVVRDSAGKLIANRPIGIRIEILQGSATGSLVFAETHTLTSNANGLVSMEVGGGTSVSGSFSGIDWSAGPYYIKTAADPSGGTNYTITGVSQLLSVPYALYAKHSENAGPKGDPGIPGPAGSEWYTGSGPAPLSLGEINDIYVNTINGDYYKKTDATTWTYQGRLKAPQGPAGKNGAAWITGNGLPDGSTGEIGDLFLDTASGTYYRKTDNTTWNLVNIFKGIKGDKGDTGSLWYTGAGKPAIFIGRQNDLFLDTANGDYYKKTDANTWEKQSNLLEKAGLNGTKNYVVKFDTETTGGNSQIFDSVRVGINTNKPAGKLHIKGNNTISELVIDAAGKQANKNPIMKLRNSNGKDVIWIHSDDTNNLFIGREAGMVNSTFINGGIRNTFIGSRAGYANGRAEDNSAFGFMALSSNTKGSYNTAIGSYALYSNTEGTFNTAIGYKALYSGNSLNGNNTAVGAYALYSSSHGFSNTVVGVNAMYYNFGGFGNTALGQNALYSDTNGVQNTAVGMGALYLNNGSYNTAGGYEALSGNVTGSYNTAFGQWALNSNKAGSNGTAFGYEAMYYANNTSTAFTNYNVAFGYQVLRGSSTPASNTGNENTGIGYQVLTINTTGNANTGTGRQALYANTKGSHNVAFGPGALYGNTTASRNIAIGRNALYIQSYSNSDAAWNSDNIAIGYEAMYSNQPTTNANGNANTAIGNLALRNNTAGDANTGIGFSVLNSNTSGVHNTAVGYKVLYANTDGKENTSTGMWGLLSNTSGAYNTGNGSNSLHDNTSGNYNAVLGMNSLYTNSTGSGNTAAGYFADANSTGYSNSSALGNTATITASNQVRFGNSSITSIGGYANWTNMSDARYKKNIKEDVPGLAFIRLLRPVTYQLEVEELAVQLGEERNQVKPDGFTRSSRNTKERIIQTGFLAQEIEAAARSIGYNFSGVNTPGNEKGLYGLRYAVFVVPLVKAVQEQQDMLDVQGEKFADIQKQIDELKRQILEGKTE